MMSGDEKLPIRRAAYRRYRTWAKQMKRESDRKIRLPHSRAKLLTRILLEYKTATDRRNYTLREGSGNVVVHTALFWWR